MEIPGILELGIFYYYFMQALSQKKKIGILAVAILVLTVLGLVGTGHMSLSGLMSDSLNSSGYACSENGQKLKLSQYKRAPSDQRTAQSNINIISGEIVILNQKITEKNVIIAEKQALILTRPAEIVRIKALIAPLTTYINTQCKNVNTSICNNKKTQKAKLEAEIVKLNKLESEITKLQNEIGTNEQATTLK
jgi:peptidoglycan hydrolase CwlO-like protein